MGDLDLDSLFPPSASWTCFSCKKLNVSQVNSCIDCGIANSKWVVGMRAGEGVYMSKYIKEKDSELVYIARLSPSPTLISKIPCPSNIDDFSMCAEIAITYFDGSLTRYLSKNNVDLIESDPAEFDRNLQEHFSRVSFDEDKCNYHEKRRPVSEKLKASVATSPLSVSSPTPVSSTNSLSVVPSVKTASAKEQAPAPLEALFPDETSWRCFSCKHDNTKVYTDCQNCKLPQSKWMVGMRAGEGVYMSKYLRVDDKDLIYIARLSPSPVLVSRVPCPMNLEDYSMCAEIAITFFDGSLVRFLLKHGGGDEGDVVTEELDGSLQEHFSTVEFDESKCVYHEKKSKEVVTSNNKGSTTTPTSTALRMKPASISASDAPNRGLRSKSPASSPLTKTTTVLRMPSDPSNLSHHQISGGTADNGDRAPPSSLDALFPAQELWRCFSCKHDNTKVYTDCQNCKLPQSKWMVGMRAGEGVYMSKYLRVDGKDLIYIARLSPSPVLVSRVPCPMNLEDYSMCAEIAITFFDGSLVRFLLKLGTDVADIDSQELDGSLQEHFSTVEFDESKCVYHEKRLATGSSSTKESDSHSHQNSSSAGVASKSNPHPSAIPRPPSKALISSPLTKSGYSLKSALTESSGGSLQKDSSANSLATEDLTPVTHRELADETRVPSNTVVLRANTMGRPVMPSPHVTDNQADSDDVRVKMTSVRSKSALGLGSPRKDMDVSDGNQQPTAPSKAPGGGSKPFRRQGWGQADDKASVETETSPKNKSSGSTAGSGQMEKAKRPKSGGATLVSVKPTVKAVAVAAMFTSNVPSSEKPRLRKNSLSPRTNDIKTSLEAARSSNVVVKEGGSAEALTGYDPNTGRYRSKTPNDNVLKTVKQPSLPGNEHSQSFAAAASASVRDNGMGMESNASRVTPNEGVSGKKTPRAKDQKSVSTIGTASDGMNDLENNSSASAETSTSPLKRDNLRSSRTILEPLHTLPSIIPTEEKKKSTTHKRRHHHHRHKKSVEVIPELEAATESPEVVLEVTRDEDTRQGAGSKNEKTAYQIPSLKIAAPPVGAQAPSLVAARARKLSRPAIAAVATDVGEGRQRKSSAATVISPQVVEALNIKNPNSNVAVQSTRPRKNSLTVSFPAVASVSADNYDTKSTEGTSAAPSRPRKLSGFPTPMNSESVSGLGGLLQRSGSVSPRNNGSSSPRNGAVSPITGAVSPRNGPPGIHLPAPIYVNPAPFVVSVVPSGLHGITYMSDKQKGMKSTPSSTALPSMPDKEVRSSRWGLGLGLGSLTSLFSSTAKLEKHPVAPAEPKPVVVATATGAASASIGGGGTAVKNPELEKLSKLMEEAKSQLAEAPKDDPSGKRKEAVTLVTRLQRIMESINQSPKAKSGGTTQPTVHSNDSKSAVAKSKDAAQTKTGAKTPKKADRKVIVLTKPTNAIQAGKQKHGHASAAPVTLKSTAIATTAVAAMLMSQQIPINTSSGFEEEQDTIVNNSAEDDRLHLAAYKSSQEPGDVLIRKADHSHNDKVQTSSLEPPRSDIRYEEGVKPAHGSTAVHFHEENNNTAGDIDLTPGPGESPLVVELPLESQEGLGDADEVLEGVTLDDFFKLDPNVKSAAEAYGDQGDAGLLDGVEPEEGDIRRFETAEMDRSGNHQSGFTIEYQDHLSERYFETARKELPHRRTNERARNESIHFLPTPEPADNSDMMSQLEDLQHQSNAAGAHEKSHLEPSHAYEKETYTVEAERIAREKAEKSAAEEAERIAKEKAEKAAAEEAERIAREKAEKSAAEEAERITREKEEKSAAEDAERIAREKAEKSAAEEAERIAREKAEKAAAEEAERITREKEEKSAAEEAERIAREKAEKAAAEEAERIAREKAEKAAAEEDMNTGIVAGAIEVDVISQPKDALQTEDTSSSQAVSDSPLRRDGEERPPKSVVENNELKFHKNEDERVTSEKPEILSIAHTHALSFVQSVIDIGIMSERVNSNSKFLSEEDLADNGAMVAMKADSDKVLSEPHIEALNLGLVTAATTNGGADGGDVQFEFIELSLEDCDEHLHPCSEEFGGNEDMEENYPNIPDEPENILHEKSASMGHLYGPIATDSPMRSVYTSSPRPKYSGTLEILAEEHEHDSDKVGHPAAHLVEGEEYEDEDANSEADIENDMKLMNFGYGHTEEGYEPPRYYSDIDEEDEDDDSDDSEEEEGDHPNYLGGSGVDGHNHNNNGQDGGSDADDPLRSSYTPTSTIGSDITGRGFVKIRRSKNTSDTIRMVGKKSEDLENVVSLRKFADSTTHRNDNVSGDKPEENVDRFNFNTSRFVTQNSGHFRDEEGSSFDSDNVTSRTGSRASSSRSSSRIRRSNHLESVTIAEATGAPTPLMTSSVSIAESKAVSSLAAKPPMGPIKTLEPLAEVKDESEATNNKSEACVIS